MDLSHHFSRTVRPRNLSKALKSRSFKQQLPKFLVKDWADKRHFPILCGKNLYVGLNTDCLQFSGINGMVEVISVPHLECNHSEADIRICLHATDAGKSNCNAGDIVVRASDTDVAVILLHHCHRIKSNVWIDTGTKGQGNSVCVGGV